jgi:hypothetical protein
VAHVLHQLTDRREMSRYQHLVSSGVEMALADLEASAADSPSARLQVAFRRQPWLELWVAVRLPRDGTGLDRTVYEVGCPTGHTFNRVTLRQLCSCETDSSAPRRPHTTTG